MKIWKYKPSKKRLMLSIILTSLKLVLIYLSLLLVSKSTYCLQSKYETWILCTWVFPDKLIIGVISSKLDWALCRSSAENQM